MNGNAHVSRVDEPIPLLDCTYNGRFAGLARDLVRAEPHRGHGDTALAAARCSCQARSSQSHRRAVGKMAGQTSHPLLSVTFAASVSVESAAMSLDAVQTLVVVERTLYGRKADSNVFSTRSPERIAFCAPSLERSPR